MVQGVHDKVLINGDLDTTLDELEKFVFGSEDKVNGDSSSTEQLNDTPTVDNEVEMLDGNVPVILEETSQDAAATS